MADDAARVDISRLKRRRDFLRVAAERRKWVTPGLILQAAPMPRGPESVARTAKSRKAKAVSADAPFSSLDAEQSSSALAAEGACVSQESSELLAPKSAETTVPAPPMARVGFTVSKKVGNSVQRNRARRRLRAVVDQLMAELATPNTDYVLIGRVDTLERPFEALLSDFRTAMKRVLTASKSAPYPSKGGKSAGYGRGKGRRPASPDGSAGSPAAKADAAPSERPQGPKGAVTP